MEEKRRARLLALAEMMLEWLAEDWDQPAVHGMRRAVGGYKETEQQIFASTVRGDLGELRRLLAASVTEPDVIDSLISDLASVRNDTDDGLGRLLLMAENTLCYLRLERSSLRRALQGLVRAKAQKAAHLTGCACKEEWSAARKALRTGGFDFMKGKPK